MLKTEHNMKGFCKTKIYLIYTIILMVVAWYDIWLVQHLGWAGILLDISIGFLILAIFRTRGLSAGYIDFCNPLVLFFAYISIYYLIRLIFIAIFPSITGAVNNISYYSIPVLMVSVSLFSFTIGYLLIFCGLIRNNNKIPIICTSKSTFMTATFFWIIGLAFQLLLIYRGIGGAVGADSFGSFLSMTGSFEELGFATLLVCVVNMIYSGKWLIRISIIVGIQAIVGILSGWRGTIIFAVMIAIMSFSIARGRIKIRTIIVTSVILIIILLFFIGPFVMGYRYGGTSGFEDRVKIGIIKLSNNYQASMLYIINRNNGIDQLIQISQKIPIIIDYQNGKTLWPILVSVIPRIIWQDKPQYNFGSWFAHTILGLPSDIVTNIPATVPGELYLNYGYIGLIIGYILIGILTGLINRLRFKHDAAILGLFICILFRIINVEPWIGMTVVAILQDMAAFIVFILFRQFVKNSMHRFEPRNKTSGNITDLQKLI